MMIVRRAIPAVALFAALAFASLSPLHAQPKRPASSAAMPLARGEVIEVDAKERRLLVKHGPLRNLGMDAMTMEFLVPPGEPLPALKPHDRIRFAADWANGEYLITRIEVVKRKGR